jgi:uncharacterized protein (UPF0276 family)
VNRFDFPNLGIGIGLRTVHYAHILEQLPNIAWFEIISDNYMYTAGKPLYYLDRLAEVYPMVMHGVSLSIGSTDPLDFDYLRELKKLRNRIGARWFSDHLCWTGVAGNNSHDLLPLPYTEESLHHVIARVRAVQDYMEAPLLLENPSSYVEFAGSTLTEWQFLSLLSEEADCGLLLDVNNVYVSAHNHGFSAAEYLARIPAHRIAQLHVAGHTCEGDLIIDTHIGPVARPVWNLLGDAYKMCGGASVLLEWDAQIPEFEAVWLEAQKATAVLGALDASEPRNNRVCA